MTPYRPQAERPAYPDVEPARDMAAPKARSRWGYGWHRFDPLTGRCSCGKTRERLQDEWEPDDDAPEPTVVCP